MEIGWKTHEKFFGFISVVAILIIVDIGWKMKAIKINTSVNLSQS